MEHILSNDVSAILPQYVKDLPFVYKFMWIAAFNQATDIYGADKAIRIANQWVRMQMLKDAEQKPNETADSELAKEISDLTELSKVNPKVDTTNEVVASSKEAILSLNLISKEKVLFSNDANGDIIMDAVLASDLPRQSDKLQYTASALQSMADQINVDGLTLPDVEHETWNKLLEESADTSEFKSRLKQQKGMLKKVKAFVANGKLFIRAWLDKRYKNHTDKFNNLSIETYAPINKRNGNKIEWAEALGLTFTNNPEIGNANILSVSV